MRYAQKSAPPPGTEQTEFVLSDGSVDRMGDVIDQAGWQLANFKTHPIALFNHDRDQVIGKWADVKVRDDRLIGRLELAKEDPRTPIVNAVRALHEQGLLRAVSVGFLPIESEPINPKEPWAGYRFKKQELLECSLVAVPANPHALSTAKSLNLPPDVIDAVFCKSADSTAFDARASIGKPAARNMLVPARAMTMSNSQQRIEELRNQVTQRRDRLAFLQSQEVLNPGELQEFAEMPGLLEQAVQGLRNYEAAERAQALASQLNTPAASAPAAPAIITARRPVKSAFDHLLRCFVVTGAAYHLKQHPEQVLRERYGNDEQTLAVLKTATTPAMTGVATWAAELVETALGDFLDLLIGNFIYPELAAIGVRVTFDRAGKISLPTRGNSKLLAGDFVGEGLPIPVQEGVFSSVLLQPKKMAVITTYTREMAMHSTPTIEGILRQAILDDTGKILDTRLLDAVAGSVTRPPGLLFGVTPITATPITGGALAALVTDLTNLVSALLAANAGRTIVLIMNPVDALRATMITNTNGVFVFDSLEALRAKFNIRAIVTSTTVTPKTVIALDAADFATATGDAPQFDVSNQATLHMDTAPGPIATVGSPNVVAAPTRSLWQTDTIGVRMILDVTWAMRRTGMVQVVQNVTW